MVAICPIRYKKLMLRRIDWNMKYQKAVGAEEEDEEDEEDEAAEQKRLNNKCVQVWEVRATFPVAAPALRQLVSSCGSA
jgi:hypothetical protein